MQPETYTTRMKTKLKKKKKPKKSARKLTAAEKKTKRERQKKFQTIVVNGKQKHVPREPEIVRIPVDQWIRDNADPIWVHQNGMREYIERDTPDQPLAPNHYLRNDDEPF